MNIKRTLKRLIDDTQYVAALEKQNDLLKENLQQEKDNLQKQKEDFRKEKELKVADEEAQYMKRSRNYLRPIADMQRWLLENYEFRYNVITDVFEYRKKAEAEVHDSEDAIKHDSEDAIKHDFEIIDKYAINTIAIEVQEAGIFVRDHFVERLIKSKYAQPYHPIRSYINQVRGTWDGKDRIGDFLRRINHSDYCQRMGRIWLRAMVAQMAGYDEKHANSVMLTLVSTTQGLHKSTFLRSLLPNGLRDYYTDDFSLNQKGNAQRKIVEFAIINDDELDKENPKKMPLMKTLMQTMKPSFIGAYKKNFNRLPRSASFTGTSNQRELLTDRSGSRRFLILELDGMINVKGIEHDAIYAQLLYEVEHGEPYFFSKNDEKEMQEHNLPYYIKTDLERTITSYFRTPKNAKLGEKLTADIILKKLRTMHANGVQNIAMNPFSKTLTHLFGKPEHTRNGNLYLVEEIR